MMKYILLLLFVPAVLFGQTKIDALVLSDGVAAGTAYANSNLDTSVAYDLRGYDAAWLEVVALDSVEVYLHYMPSHDGSTFRAQIAVDSLISAVNAGNHVTFPIPAKAMGNHRAKFVLAFEAAGNGVTSATYTARLIRKKY